MASTSTPQLLLLLCCCCLCTTAQDAPSSLRINDDVVVGWAFNEDMETISFTLVFRVKAWIGIGWQPGNSTATGMPGADIVVVEYQDNGAVAQVTDRKAECFCAPALDTDIGGEENILSAAAMQLLDASGNTVSYASFTRKLDTGDVVADNALIRGALYNLIWAHGQDGQNTLAPHGPGNAGNVIGVNFFEESNPSVTDNSTLRRWHASLMFLAYGICMSAGVFVSRFLKSIEWWFPLHICLMLTAMAAAIAGVVIAVLMVSAQFRAYHAYFGAVTLLLTFLQPFLGLAADRMWDPERKRIPIFPDMIHWWIGRITLLLSYATIFMGIYEMGLPTEIYYAFGILLVIYFSVYFLVDVRTIWKNEEGAVAGMRDYISPYAAYTPCADRTRLSKEKKLGDDGLEEYSTFSSSDFRRS